MRHKSDKFLFDMVGTSGFSSFKKDNNHPMLNLFFYFRLFDDDLLTLFQQPQLPRVGIFRS
jgi:hypothetical protein